jgi:two-component SAPR family response regulator
MNAADAYSNYQSLNPDVAFLDIEMPETNGLELAEKIMSAGSDIEIIFVTAYDQYALEAFSVNALDYLLKPLSYDAVERTVSRLKKRKRLLSPVIPADRGYVYCFGCLSVYGADRRLPIKWRTSKAEELFAFMLQNLNEEVSKWKICEALWPNYNPDKVDMYLHTTIYKMKKVLASANIKFNFTFINGRYKLDLPGIYTDTAEFDSVADTYDVLSEGSIERYEKAFSLYKGDYLEENDYPWSLSKMEEYAKKYSNLASSLAKYYMEKTEYSAAEKILHKVLVRFPLDDDFNEMLLKLYLTKNNRVALATHYKTIKELYMSELGIEPSNAMKSLYDSISEL